MQQIWQKVFIAHENKSNKRILSIGILLLSIGFILYGIISQWNTLVHFEWQVDWARVIWAFVFFPFGVFPTVYAWHLLVSGFGAHQLFYDNATVFILSSLPKRLPGLVWYISSRSLWYQERGTSTVSVLLATTWETLALGISGLVLYVLIALISHARLVLSWTLIGIFSLVTLLLAILVSPLVLKKILVKLGQSQVQYISIINLLSVFLLYSFAWIAGGTFFYFLITSLCGPLPFWPLASIWIASSVAGVFASILQGIGIKELTMTMLLSDLLPLPVSAAMAVIIRVVHTLSEVIFLFFLLPFLTLKKSNSKGVLIKRPDQDSS